MPLTEFVDDLTGTLWQVLSVRDAALSRLHETVKHADMRALLRGGLQTEIEAAEIAAVWMPTTDDLEAKLAFARQAGDEAKHYQFVAARLEELGAPPEERTIGAERTRLYRYFESLETTVERVAATQFTREAIGFKSNELFIKFCEVVGDNTTADMYREKIQPDEWHHHEWGKALLARLVRDTSQEAAARAAVLRTLELAEELRSLAAGRLLVEALPGC